jgi:hypothetical protein
MRKVFIRVRSRVGAIRLLLMQILLSASNSESGPQLTQRLYLMLNIGVSPPQLMQGVGSGIIVRRCPRTHTYSQLALPRLSFGLNLRVVPVKQDVSIAGICDECWLIVFTLAAVDIEAETCAAMLAVGLLKIVVGRGLASDASGSVEVGRSFRTAQKGRVVEGVLAP